MKYLVSIGKNCYKLHSTRYKLKAESKDRRYLAHAAYNELNQAKTILQSGYMPLEGLHLYLCVPTSRDNL